MKKLAIFLAIMLIPFSAFALDTITDNDMNEVTGQAGVSILTNSINIVKTGVTTTYTDDGTNEITIVAQATDQSIYFGGSTPIMIDVVDMATLQATLTGYGMAMDTADFSDTGVQITLPDSINIVDNLGSRKDYYTGGTANVGDDAQRLISVTKNGGTTTIQQATMGWSGGALKHDNNIKIIMTAHDGDG